MKAASVRVDCSPASQLCPLRSVETFVVDTKLGWSYWRDAQKVVLLSFVLLFSALAIAEDATSAEPQPAQPVSAEGATTAALAMADDATSAEPQPAQPVPAEGATTAPLAMADDATSAEPQLAQPTLVQPTSWMQRVMNQDHMTRDWGGLRPKLEKKGISFVFFQHTDLFGAVSGGNGQGFGVWNRIRGIAVIDMGKLAHIKGLSIVATSTWNNGTDVGFDPRYLGSLFVTEGNDTYFHQLRMDQWWVQQDLFNKKLSLQGGQFGAETYFV